MWPWLRRIRSAVRRRSVLAAALSGAEPERSPVDRYERGELIGRSFIGRDGEMKALPLPEARDERFDPRLALIPRDVEGRLHGW